MSYVQGPLSALSARLLQFHLLVAGISLLGFALDIKNSFCKCEDFPIEDRPFVAIWNAPTGGCYVNYSININLRDFDILENPKQTWDGKYVTVFIMHSWDCIRILRTSKEQIAIMEECPR